MIKKILTELNQFRKDPIMDLSKSNFKAGKIKLFFILFGINLLVGFFILSFITGAIRIIFHINFSPIDITLAQLLIANIVFIPVFEEIAFRLPLKLSKWNISLSLYVITFFVCSYFYKIDPININNFLYQRLLISFVVFLLAFAFLNNKYVFEAVYSFITQNYKLFFYTLLLLFTLRHIDNYQLNLITFLFLPILLLPQFISGFFIAYTRLKINFISAIIFHFLINLISFLPQLTFLLYGN